MSAPAQTPLQGLSNAPVTTQGPNHTASQNSVPQFDPQKLADIHLPDTISYWPVAPGWWILLGLLLFILLSIVFFKLRKKSQSYKKAQRLKQLKNQASTELQNIKAGYKEHGIPQRTVKQLSIFLRRFVLSLYPREKVASLTDQQWLLQLDELSQSKQFSKHYADLLIHVPYQSENKMIDNRLLSGLFKASEQLIENLAHQDTPVQEKARV